MPFYDYRCPACETAFEELVRDADQLVQCPKCASREVQRQLSTFAVGRASPAARSRPAPGPGCGACGDPRGPGACQL